MVSGVVGAPAVDIAVPFAPLADCVRVGVFLRVPIQRGCPWLLCFTAYVRQGRAVGYADAANG